MIQITLTISTGSGPWFSSLPLWWSPWVSHMIFFITCCTMSPFLLDVIVFGGLYKASTDFPYWVWILLGAIFLVAIIGLHRLPEVEFSKNINQASLCQNFKCLLSHHLSGPCWAKICLVCSYYQLKRYFWCMFPLLAIGISSGDLVLSLFPCKCCDVWSVWCPRCTRPRPLKGVIANVKPMNKSLSRKKLFHIWLMGGK